MRINKGDDQTAIISDDVSKVETIHRIYFDYDTPYGPFFIIIHISHFFSDIYFTRMSMKRKPCDERYCKLHHIKLFYGL